MSILWPSDVMLDYLEEGGQMHLDTDQAQELWDAIQKFEVEYEKTRVALQLREKADA